VSDIGALLHQPWTRTRALLPRLADLTVMRQQPRRDVVSGLTVALVALPLALAFGISSGLGARAGIITAIIAGLVAAFFGGSNLQVSGPTGAMTVVLVPIVAKYGPSGVLVVGMLAGIVLVGLAYARAGRFMQFIPIPVIEGFTLGIALIIALQQVPSALGVKSHGTGVLQIAARSVGTWLSHTHWTPLLVAAGVAFAILASARLRPGLPVSLIAVTSVAVAAAAAHLSVTTIGVIPSGLPAPHVPTVPVAELSSLAVPAIAVAVLAALESLLCATVADAMSVGERHDSDRELFGQGLANLVTPLFGGVPATAAIARTAVNVRAGARSRLAAITQSLVLLLVVLVAARFVSYIPLAALAGVLMATAVQMVQVSSLRALLHSTRGDAVALIVTAAATVLLNLVTAVLLGLVVACVFALRQVANATRLEEVPLDSSDHSAEEQSLLDEHVVAYRLDGALFFGAAHAFLLELSKISDVRVVILRMSRLSTLDATGASVLADAIKQLEGRGITVMLSGIHPEHARVLERLGVYDELAHERHVFAHTPDAIAHARLHAASGHPALTHPPVTA
jgi:MFS superfamily sulfate permease-like transporter